MAKVSKAELAARELACSCTFLGTTCDNRRAGTGLMGKCGACFSGVHGHATAKDAANAKSK